MSIHASVVQACDGVPSTCYRDCVRRHVCHKELQTMGEQLLKALGLRLTQADVHADGKSWVVNIYGDFQKPDFDVWNDWPVVYHIGVESRYCVGGQS